MFGCENKLKPSGDFCKVLTCLFGCMYLEIIQHQAYFIPLGIFGVKQTEEFYVFLTAVTIPYKRDCFSGLQIDPGKKRNSPKAFILVISVDVTVVFIRGQVL